MKKILAIVTMAAMVAGAAFADPEADFNLAEVTGNASVTWGVDLDNSTTGFKNDTSATVKLNLVNKGTKSTSGEGIWAELGVKYDGSLQVKSNSGTDDGKPAFDGGVASIDVAKLHFYNFYVGIKSGDTLVGEFNVPNAVYSSKVRVGNVVDTSHTQGIVLGYGDNKNINFEFDFRSNNAGDKYYTNDYGLAAELKFLDSNEIVNGLFATAGVAYQFDAQALGAAASAGYKLKLNDTYYVKPTVGFTMSSVGGANEMNLAAGLLFGWGDEADSNAGVPYLCDETKKVTPGVGVAVSIPLADGSTIKVFPSLYTGTLIENLTAAVLAEIDIPSSSDIEFGVAGGLKYALAVNDAVTVTPFAGARFNKGANTTAAIFTNACQANKDNGGKDDSINGADTLLNVKVGLDVAGLINNTTFSVDWTSRNLLGDDDTSKIGTINVTCKISF